MKLTSVARRLGLAFNTVMTLFGVALGVMSIVYMVTETRPELTPRGALWCGLGAALLVVLNGILGMMCTMSDPVSDPTSKDQVRSGWKCYLFLAVVLLGIAGVGMRWARMATDQKPAINMMSRLWNKLPDDTALAIQTMGQCCGFNNYTDRIQEPCIRFQQQVGCGKIMAGYYVKAVDRLTVYLWVFLSIMAAAVVSGCGLWICGERALSALDRLNNATPSAIADGTVKPHDPYLISIQPGTPKGQSYEDWHRTVFQ